MDPRERTASIPASLGLLLAAIAAAGCPDHDPGSPLVDSVSPARGVNTKTTQVSILGSRYSPAVLANFDEVENARVDAAFKASLGQTELESITFVSPTELSAVVPKGMTPGLYNLSLVDPAGRKGFLKDAFEVTAPPHPDGGQDAPDGARGEAIPEGGTGETGLRDAVGEGDGHAPQETGADKGAKDQAADKAKKDSTPVDGGATCSWSGTAWTFATPTAVTELNSSSTESEPVLSDDGLKVWFASYRGGNNDIYTGTRTSTTGTFTGIAAWSGLNTTSSETHFAMSANQLAAILATDRSGGKGGSDLWVATRTSTATSWTTAAFTPASSINTTSDEFDGVLSRDGLRVYFCSNGLGGSGSWELATATRSGTTSAFGTPTLMTSLNSSALDSNPTLSSDELLIIFSSFRTGGSGDADLYYATRTSTSTAFSAPKALPVVNSASLEGEPFLTYDKCEIYFASDRTGGLGSWDIYRAKFVP
jgi:hypothetical protein